MFTNECACNIHLGYICEKHASEIGIKKEETIIAKGYILNNVYYAEETN